MLAVWYHYIYMTVDRKRHNLALIYVRNLMCLVIDQRKTCMGFDIEMTIDIMFSGRRESQLTANMVKPWVVNQSMK